jgi:Na+/alanine symporter
MDSTGVWVLVDFCNAMAAIPNMVGLLCLSGKSLSALEKWRQMEERKSFFQKPKKGVDIF